MGSPARHFVGSWRLAPRLLVATLALLLLGADIAHAQLRVVTYNTHFDGPFPGLSTVLQAIGQTERNGIAKPIDVLLLQEQNGPSGDTQAIVEILNGIYGAGVYGHGNLVGGSTDADDRQTIIYNTQTIQFTPTSLPNLNDEAAVGTSNSNGQPRQAMRYRLRPMGYDDSSAQFYAYNSHYKANDDTTSEGQRLIEANAIRNNADGLPDDTHIIYAGDHNFYRSTDDAFERLVSAGNAQAMDPINRIGAWHNGGSFADVHTQAPCASGCPTGFTTGGMDDRFDFQLMTAEFLDSEGLDYIPGSYYAFGNNGSVPCCNSNINIAANTVTFPGSSFTQDEILNALFTASDHLPVVADYQLPAVLNAVTGSVPMTLNVGELFNLDVTVSNAANVLVPIGADELDYSLTTDPLGDVSGSVFNQVDPALGGGNVHQVLLDTSSPGIKSGTILVQSASQAVLNAIIEIPISYEVLAAGLYGDYNNDTVVDAADYTVWRNMLGQSLALDNEDPTVTPGSVTPEDFEVWKAHFGQSLPAGGAGSAGVPEPATGVSIWLGVCLVALRPDTLRAWTRTK